MAHGGVGVWASLWLCRVRVERAGWSVRDGACGMERAGWSVWGAVCADAVCAGGGACGVPCVRMLCVRVPRAGAACGCVRPPARLDSHLEGVRKAANQRMPHPIEHEALHHRHGLPRRHPPPGRQCQ